VEVALALANDAEQLAAAPLERARALEILGLAAYASFDATRAWHALREAADIVRRETPFDRTRIADICGRAVVIPARNLGMMAAPLQPEEVAPYLALGLDCAGEGDSEALARLLASEGNWTVGFAAEATASNIQRGHRAAERARDMARRLGRADLELMALDALGAAEYAHGHFGLAERYDHERLQILRTIRDPFEIADTYFTACWTALEVGRFAEVVTLGEEFDNARTGNPVGALALRAAARIPLGQWEPALVDQAHIRELLGDQAPFPPSFASAGYGAELLIRTARGEDAAADAGIAELWQWAHQNKPTRLWPFPAMALALARQGDFTGSRRVLEELPRDEMSRPGRLEALCTLVAEEGAWDEWRSLVSESRSLAESGRLLALPLHADRLEGRALAASGEASRAVTPLERAVAGFAQLGAQWELALTQLSLGEALATLDRNQEAQQVLDAASHKFEQLRVPREHKRAQTILRRLRRT
jgi:tetratricopeptide (TPR) repeat protein